MKNQSIEAGLKESALIVYKEPRSLNEVSKDMNLLWKENPESCLNLSIAIRTKLKNEGIMRMMWIAINHPDTFKNNFSNFLEAGSWKDVFKMMSLDLQYNGWKYRKLDWNFLYNSILAGINNPATTDLVRKYLPTIRTNKHCKTLESKANTLIGRWLARKLSLSYKDYRKLKSAGVAHQWQQLISKQLYNSIDFSKIPSKALSLLVHSKFINNHYL